MILVPRFFFLTLSFSFPFEKLSKKLQSYAFNFDIFIHSIHYTPDIFFREEESFKTLKKSNLYIKDNKRMKFLLIVEEI